MPQLRSNIGLGLVVIIIMACCSNVMSLQFYQYLYGISLTIKSLIIFLLPLIIFGLLFRSVFNLSHNATKIISLILIGVCCSTIIALTVSNIVGSWVYNFDLAILLPQHKVNLEPPAWSLELPKIITNDKAMFAGIFLGILANFFKRYSMLNFMIQKLAFTLEVIIAKILQIFTKIIPLFIAGFIAKLQYDGAIGLIIKDYFVIFIVIAAIELSYIILIYFLLNNCSLSKLFNSIKNMLPAAISGFSTMSSAATMPLTIVGIEKNIRLKYLAHSIVPATVNIHLIGDSLAIPILAYTVLKNYAIPQPSLMSYVIFAGYFLVAKFSSASVPGGGILVMLPVLEARLKFNSDMMSLITALYILFDPIITCVNVLGNGAFAKMIDHIWYSFHKVTKVEQHKT